jgi:hypothetical protein
MEQLVLGGYFPKKVETAPDWIKAPHVSDVCSVSDCVAPGPGGWIDKWLHNGRALYDSEELALRVIPAGDETFRVLAFRFLPLRYRNNVILVRRMTVSLSDGVSGVMGSFADSLRDRG